MPYTLSITSYFRSLFRSVFSAIPPPNGFFGRSRFRLRVLQFGQLFVGYDSLVPVVTENAKNVKSGEMADSGRSILLPFGHVPRPVAHLGDIVEHLTSLAPVSPRHFPINADVEELTVLRVGVPRVLLPDRFVHLWATELEDVLRGASLLLCLVRPAADAGVLVVDQSGGADNHVEFAVDAVVELITDTGIFVGEVTVESGTVERWLGCF